MKSTLYSLFLIFILTILSCKKDTAGTGGKATLKVQTRWSNNGTKEHIYGATIYIWFDGTNADGNGGYVGASKNPASADLKVTASSAESEITVSNLKYGKYAWQVYGGVPAYPFNVKCNGHTEIKWKDRKSTVTVENLLY